MNDEIICPECPSVYSATDITATYGDETTTLAELNGKDHDSPKINQQLRRNSMFGRITAKPQPPPPEPDTGTKPDLQQIRRLRAWTFTCPHGHNVDGNRGTSLPIAVVGETGSSKSHFLPGLVWELDSKRALGPLGISLREAIYTKVDLVQSMSLIYESLKVVDPTPAGRLLGPYGYRLSIRHGDQDERYSLLLFDVAGEDLGSIVRIAENAKFILMCRGLIILIDPVGILPTQFDLYIGAEQARRIHLNSVRKGISRLADTLEEIYHKSSHLLDIPVAVVVAKADCIQWQLEWQHHTAAVLEAFRNGASVSDSLGQVSQSVKEALEASSAELLVQEVSERFDQRVTRYVAASATSEMPFKQDPEGEACWTEPDPNGTALALLHILDMIGALKRVHKSGPERR
jgi:hypothetical protein